MSKTSLIVVGEMNIDIVVSGLPYFPQSGQLVNGDKLTFGPGGKSRNIAAMAGALMPAGNVAMVSKTVEDEYGLWRIPVKALQDAGVSTDYVKVLKRGQTDSLPGFALILVDRDGHNEIVGAPGITRKLNQDDIDIAEPLLHEVGANSGFLAVIGNTPMEVTQHAIQKSASHDVRVLYDPGGADDTHELVPLIDRNIWLVKPNEHEAEDLSGIKVTDFESAKAAAAKLMERGVTNVLITAGVNGAYLFSEGIAEHISIPQVEDSDVHDETGCGDQVMAALCAFLSQGDDLRQAAAKSILAGTLQFHRSGIQPGSVDDIAREIRSTT